MKADAELPFERFRYWAGQQVRARDFSAQLAEVDRLTSWHNRAVHDAFGVRFGLDVTGTIVAGEPRVRIECGVAYDCSGAMLMLQQPRELPLPPLSSAEFRVLIMRSRGQHRTGPCDQSSESPAGRNTWLEHDVEFIWTRARHVDVHAGVPLARAVRSQFAEMTTLDMSVRMRARPMTRPRLGSGETIPGLTPWEPTRFALQTRIDTSAAGFTRVPAYFASLIATRPSSRFAQLMPLLALRHIADPGLTDFTYRIIIRSEFRRQSPNFAEVTRELGLAVCWLGCQGPEFTAPACPGQRIAPPDCSDDGDELS